MRRHLSTREHPSITLRPSNTMMQPHKRITHHLRHTITPTRRRITRGHLSITGALHGATTGAGTGRMAAAGTGVMSAGGTSGTSGGGTAMTTTAETRVGGNAEDQRGSCPAINGAHDRYGERSGHRQTSERGLE